MPEEASIQVHVHPGWLGQILRVLMLLAVMAGAMLLAFQKGVETGVIIGLQHRAIQESTTSARSECCLIEASAREYTHGL